ncbi:MAG: class I SAM-dependent methyltransferase [Planctomycetes bacterium]|nr:class I SAM-dependent methyltransferase [Planctomycetota bacterium]
MNEHKKLKANARWYKSRKSFDYHLIKYGAKTILKHIGGPAVLEMSCGSGVMTEELVKRFPGLTVVEGSPLYIRETMKFVNPKKAEFICALFEDFTPKEKFNDIIMSSILEHVANPVKLLKRVKRWLAPHGRIHLIVPNAHSLHRRIGKAMGLIKRLDQLQKQDYLIGHRRYYSLMALQTDIKKAGLKTGIIEGVFLKPLSNQQMMGWDKETLDAFYEIGKEIPEYCAQLYLMGKSN